MSISAASCTAANGAAAMLASEEMKGSGEAYRALAATCAAASGAGALGTAQIATPTESLIAALPGSAFSPGLAMGIAEAEGLSGNPRVDAALSLLRAFASSGKAPAQAASSDPLSDLEQALKLLKSAASPAQQALSQAAARYVSPDPAFIPFARALASPFLKGAAALRRKKIFTRRRREERARTAAEQRARESGFDAGFTFPAQTA